VKVDSTEIEGLTIYRRARYHDNRGCLEVLFDKSSIEIAPMEIEIGFNRILLVRSKKGTLRGIHKAKKAMNEVKLVTCVAGEVRDILVDLRPDSKTFKCHTEVILSSTEGNAVLIPSGLGQAYEVISDEATLIYALNTCFFPENELIIDALDPELKITWSSYSYRSPKDEAARSLNSLVQDDLI